MATPGSETALDNKNSPIPPTISPSTSLLSEMSTAAKPIAAIFTKEGLQKCKEQQSVPKPKRGRKKEQQNVNVAPASTTALTPPDSAQETNTTEQIPTATKRRGRPPKAATAGGKATSTAGSSRATSTGKGKRKKDGGDDNDDADDAEFKSRPSSLRTIPLGKLTRAAAAAAKTTGVMEGEQALLSSPSAPPSAATSESGSENGMMEDVSETLVDPNHSRRKRRKKSPHSPTDDVISLAGTEEIEDVVMEDHKALELTPMKSRAFESRQTGESVFEAPPAAESNGILPISTPKEEEPSKSSQKPFPSLKPLHPFFTPGGLKKSEPAAEAKQKTAHPFFAPGGMKKPKLIPQPPPAAQTTQLSITQQPKESKPIAINTLSDVFTPSSLSPTSKTALKVSGGMDAPWPDKQQRHVRQLSPCPSFASNAPLNSIPYRSARKLKTRRVEISAAEDLLDNLAKSLDIRGCKERLAQSDFHEEQYFRVPSTIRLPKRRIMTGSQLQGEVRKRTVARLPFPGEQFVQSTRENSVSTIDSGDYEPKKVHPALLWLYSYLNVMITPFDIGDHETQLWTQKYAPQHSAEVLQVGREMEVLRDWVCKLMVDTGNDVPGVRKKKRKAKAKDGATSTAGKGGRRKKKKKRAKGDGLDDFLVDSEEELDEMDEITDPEDNDNSITPLLFGSQPKKSTIRTGDKNASIAAQLGYVPGGAAANGGGENGRMVNAVVITGPHGCGKTTAVHAVAKEMGFTVFEVNPGSRRNGKDLLDQVGEMSRNHLVHQQKANDGPDRASFFKQGKNKSKVKQIEEVIEKAQQTQSLILLEEVDLLFEEDKQFWSTVMTLMAQSKRPIVLTCNDESLLPIDDLLLHAILRLSAPPEDLTVDYCLLLAANEGHILQRKDVSQLYNTLQGDLRAMITELHFWCQMGIGDRRAGLDWILTRFPVGCDIDENGEVKRVVSEDTYLGGMGWAPPGEEDDGVSSPDCPGRKLKEEDFWKTVWEEWGVDVGGDATDMMRGMDEWVEGIKALQGYEEKHLATQAMSLYAEALSDVDVYAGMGMRKLENPVLDATQPQLPESLRSDDILGYPIIETDVWPVNSTSRDTLASMAMTVRSIARSYLASETNALVSMNNLSTMDLDVLSQHQRGITPISPALVVSTISSRKAISRTLDPIPANYLRSAFFHLVTPPLSFLARDRDQASSSSSLPGMMITTATIHGPLRNLVVDIAPHIRAIVRCDAKRDEERVRKSGVMVSQGVSSAASAGVGAGVGAGAGKRNTRRSRLAMMDVSGRRRGGWFGGRGNAVWMVGTGGEGWGEVTEGVLEKRAELMEEEQ